MRNVILLCLLALIGVACDRATIGEAVEETYFVRHDGADMPVYVRGNTASEKFVLVIHGGPGGDGFTYSQLYFAELMEQNYGMLYWDQRGQGASQGQYGEGRVTIEQMRQDLHAVVLATRKRYGDGIKLYLMGHSWGGLLGTAFVQSGDQYAVDGWIEVAGAHDLPLLYESAYAMLDSIANTQIPNGKDTLFWHNVIDRLTELPASGINLDDWGDINRLGHQAGSHNSLNEIVEPPRMRDLTVSDFIFKNPQDIFAVLFSSQNTAQLLLDEVIATDLTEEMDQIDVPTLLLWGRYDFVVPPELAETAFPRIGTSDKELVWFEASGHSPMINEPKIFVETVSDWIDRH